MIIFVIILFSTLFIVCPCYPYANKLAEHQCLQKCGILEPEIEETESHSSAGMDYSHPWIVRIEVTMQCGTQKFVQAGTGFIVDSGYVLTAAHTMYTNMHLTKPECALGNIVSLGGLVGGPANFTFPIPKWLKARPPSVRIYAKYKRSNSSPFTISEIHIGDGFNPNLIDFVPQSSDYALLKMTNPFVLGDKLRKICVPTLETSLLMQHTIADFTIVRWNVAKNADTLPKARMEFYSSLTCTDYFGTHNFDQIKQLCAANIINGVTTEDSGAPAQIPLNGRVFAFAMATNLITNTTMRQMKPDIYIRTGTMCEFMQRTTGTNVCIPTTTAEDATCRQILEQRRKRASAVKEIKPKTRNLTDDKKDQTRLKKRPGWEV